MSSFTVCSLERREAFWSDDELNERCTAEWTTQWDCSHTRFVPYAIVHIASFRFVDYRTKEKMTWWAFLEIVSTTTMRCSSENDCSCFSLNWSTLCGERAQIESCHGVGAIQVQSASNNYLNSIVLMTIQYSLNSYCCTDRKGTLHSVFFDIRMMFLYPVKQSWNRLLG